MIRFFYFFIVFVLVSALFLLSSKVKAYFNPSVPVVYGLKTEAVKRVSYLPEANPNLFPANKQTVAVYSVAKETFKLEQIFHIAGIPYVMCKDLNDAKEASILFLDFSMNHPLTLTKSQHDFLYQFVARGGMVVAVNALNTRFGALKSLFGYKDFSASRKRKSFYLAPSEYFKYFNTPEEKRYLLSTMGKSPWTNSIITGTAKPLAYFDDGSPAITVNHYKKGYAIMLGISLWDLRDRNLFGKDYMANQHYINHLEPLSDFIMLFLKGIYENFLTKSMTLHTSKDGNQATFIMTHDVDFQDSIKNIKSFTQLEERLGIKATYNILVKYITDDKDISFFKQENLTYLLKAQEEGFEIGDHTVLHSKNFFFFPKGTCNESYPEYKPFSLGEFKEKGNPTVCGEIKVAKELLLGAGIKEVTTFRSGELLYNPNLPEVLERLGFRYASCFSAEDVLSYFPYRYMRDYKTLTNPSKIWEFPLTYEDEHFPPLYFRTDKAYELFKKVYDNGGVFTVLDHNDMTWWKLKNLDPYFIEKLVSKLPKDTWIDTMKHVGDFWDKRDRVVFRYSVEEGWLNLKIYVPTDIDGLTFHLNHFSVLAEDRSVKCVGSKIIVNVKKGINQWHLKVQK
ncbi:hypothetical protein MNB_SV-3-1580 [hydrothermal vent metagenome]|uniref:NodB homology domain-containing protein n=1 Tax=hydrothermal vent metagenome TaxID=652676 RepID=A0A1W1C9T6_9ZZZZ